MPAGSATAWREPLGLVAPAAPSPGELTAPAPDLALPGKGRREHAVTAREKAFPSRRTSAGDFFLVCFLRTASLPSEIPKLFAVFGGRRAHPPHHCFPVAAALPAASPFPHGFDFQKTRGTGVHLSVPMPTRGSCTLAAPSQLRRSLPCSRAEREAAPPWRPTRPPAAGARATRVVLP